MFLIEKKTLVPTEKYFKRRGGGLLKNAFLLIASLFQRERFVHFCFIYIHKYFSVPLIIIYKVVTIQTNIEIWMPYIFYYSKKKIAPCFTPHCIFQAVAIFCICLVLLLIVYFRQLQSSTSALFYSSLYISGSCNLLHLPCFAPHWLKLRPSKTKGIQSFWNTVYAWIGVQTNINRINSFWLIEGVLTKYNHQSKVYLMCTHWYMDRKSILYSLKVKHKCHT